MFGDGLVRALDILAVAGEWRGCRLTNLAEAHTTLAISAQRDHNTSSNTANFSLILTTEQNPSKW